MPRCAKIVQDFIEKSHRMLAGHELNKEREKAGWKARRWVVEIFYSSFKHMFGEHVKACKSQEHGH